MPKTSFTTRESALYATVWPICDLELYSDSSMTENIGSVTQGSTLCVLDAKDGAFHVICDGVKGWIDDRFTMINLPDLVGDLILHDIKNSYSSIYKVHDYKIPEITDTVIKGYENIAPEGGELVPLQYRTALKLIEAAEKAGEDGYALLIYDAYRPRMATRFLYDTTEALLNDPIPYYGYEFDENGDPIIPPEELAAIAAAAEPEPEPEPVAEEAETDAEAENGEESEEIEEEPQEPPMTYYRLMTGDGAYALSHFLARSGSAHNMGIAVDLTLVRLSDGEELEMQTKIHDLSCFSVTELNNKNSKYLAKLMTGAGFGTLYSEWWHFQDNELRDSAPIKSYMEKGVSCKGWKATDEGLRYRYADGTYAKSCVLIIADEHFTFDENGYLIENQ